MSSKEQMNDQNQIDLLLLLGTFKSFSEQMHNLKGLHKGIVKRKFNILHNHINQYESSLDKTWLKENGQVIEELSDAITDLVYMIRENIGKEMPDERDNQSAVTDSKEKESQA